MSGTFANNVDTSDVRTVFSGTVTVKPQTAACQGVPQKCWYVDIPISPPFRYDPSKGKDLLIDHGVSARSAGTTRSLDGASGTQFKNGRVFSTLSATATTANGGNTSFAIITEITWVPAKGLFSSFTATPTSGPEPLKVQFTDTTFTSNPPVKTWAWDLNGDNTIDSRLQNPTFTYPKTGWDAKYNVTLTTTDGTNPASKLTKKGFITVDPHPVATAVNYGFASTTKAVSPSGPFMPIPTFSRTYTDTRGFPRGFYFQAPVTFIVTGFHVPNEAKHTLQTVAFYLLSKKPPEFASEVIPKAAELKYYGLDQKADTLLKPKAPIVVKKGDWVCVLGTNHEPAQTVYSSYSVTGTASTQMSVLGKRVSIGRLISQHIYRGTTKGLVGIAGSGTTGSKGRVEIHIVGQKGRGTIFPSMTTNGLPAIGTGFGDLLVKLPLFLTIGIPTGTGFVPLPIPTDTGLYNVLLNFQTFVFNVTTNVHGATNGTEWKIGGL